MLGCHMGICSDEWHGHLRARKGGDNFPSLGPSREQLENGKNLDGFTFCSVLGSVVKSREWGGETFKKVERKCGDGNHWTGTRSWKPTPTLSSVQH